MADENIGGIEVSASISSTTAEAQLEALLSKMQAAAKQMQAALTITPNIGGSQGTQGGSQRQQAQARTQAARQARQQEQTEEEQGRLGFQTRMAAYEMRTGQQHEARIQGTRRTAAQRAFSESERQRKAELAAQSKQYDTLAALATSYFDDQEKRAAKLEPLQAQAARQTSLTQGGYLREQQGGGTPDLSTARRRSPAEIAALRAGGGASGGGAPQAPLDSTIARDERVRMRTRASGARGPTGSNAPPGATPPPRGGGPPRPLPPEFDTPPPPRFSAADRASADARAAADEAAVKASRGGRTQTEAESELRIQSSVERQRASITAAGRTGRTESFGLGALFGGTQGKFIEASKRQATAQTELNSAMRASDPIRRRIAEYDDQISRSTGARVSVLQKERDAFAARKDVAPILNREVRATKDLVAANDELRALQGPSSIARNLLAGAAGGAAFGIAMAGIAEAGKALMPVFAETIDQLGGFAAKSTAVTSALAQQTIAQKGNVDAVLAQQAATAGLSGTAADYLDTQLKVTTQVKAGALAQKQSSDLFKAAQGTNQNVPEGLNGGYGGVGGTPFLAQFLGGGPGFRETAAGDIRQLGGASTSTTGRFGDVPGTVNDILGSLNPFGENFANPGAQIQKRDSAAALAAGDTPGVAKKIDDWNDAIKRAAAATGRAAEGTIEYTNDQQKVAQAVAIATANNDVLGASMASMGVVVKDASGNIADFTTQMDIWSQAAVGKGIPAAEELGKIASANETQREKEARASIPALQQQFAYERPAFQHQLEMQQQYQLGTQLPAQAALQNLAAPLAPVGTGILGANAAEQSKITKANKETQVEQQKLNDYYKQGEKVLIDTYQIPQQLINDIQSVGQAITAAQSGIRNEQAAYQVAQYNYQLHIARRTLADIGGLTGKNFGAGQSYLGQLEKENLALSRQGQQLQFNLSQRQINYQVALAGFQAPGVTPEERQANVKEAQIEASYAQKQLDIQKQMFGNQVQIVDIQNLRQGVDLAGQIGLLLQGRKVTIDTALAEDRIIRLQKLQDQQVAKAGTYIEKVDKAVGRAFSEIQALETAAGSAMYNAATYAASAFGIFLSGTIKDLNKFSASTMSIYGRNGTGGTGPTSKSGAASGALFNTGGGSVGAVTIGENDRNETVAVLRNPRAASGFGGGGMVNIFNITGNTVRNDGDLDEIVRKVTRAMGRDAALKGLRNN